MPLYVKKTEPILALVKKGVKWKWEKKHQKAFYKVKELFSKKIMLHRLQNE